MRCHWLPIQFIVNTIAFCLGHKRTNGPIILGWNNFFDQGNVIRTIAPEEQVEKCRRKCEYSEDREIAQNASVIVFHETAAGGDLPDRRWPGQLYVMFDLESPFRGPQFPAPNFFNLTMTYLANDQNNLMAPYGSLHKINRSNGEDLKDIWTWEEVVEKVGRKDKTALQIASNCASHSAREAYTEELSRHIEVTGYGRCFGGRNCDRKCYDTEIDRHFFYLAFENSVCRNYITEKFWNAFRHLTVPVVLSRGVMEGLDIPPGAFVAADDFGTVEEMAKFLVEMRNDRNKYLRFFNWTRFYRRNSDIVPAERAICRLCDLAHRRMAPGSKVIADIDRYWRLGGNCVLGFGAQLVLKRPIFGRPKLMANFSPLLLLFVLLIALFLRRFFHLPFSCAIKSPHKIFKRRSPIIFS